MHPLRQTLAMTLLVGSSVFLASCRASGATATYQLTFDGSKDIEEAELSLASLRVLERRVATLGEEVVQRDIVNKNEKTLITVTLSNANIIEPLTERLASPFTMNIMREAETKEADIVVEGHGGFLHTGISAEHLMKARAGIDPITSKGEVQLFFTEEGRKLLNDVFRSQQGKTIGLFVRGKLMSKLLIASEEVKDEIYIRDIPNPEIASAFADDINVGLHVTFAPAF